MDKNEFNSGYPLNATENGGEPPATLRGADLARWHIEQARAQLDLATAKREAEHRAELEAERSKLREAQAELALLRLEADYQRAIQDRTETLLESVLSRLRAVEQPSEQVLERVARAEAELTSLRELSNIDPELLNESWE